ncbi:MAG: hypothetical protein ACK5MH_07330 [Bacteroidales bacterium]
MGNKVIIDEYLSKQIKESGIRNTIERFRVMKFELDGAILDREEAGEKASCLDDVSNYLQKTIEGVVITPHSLKNLLRS